VSRRLHLARVLLAALTLSLPAATVTVVECRRRTADLSSWDETRLARELQALGYRVHVEPKDREGALLPTGRPRAVHAGLYGCREEPADWEEVASRRRGDPRAWRGCVLAIRGGHPAPEDRDYLAAPPWVFQGDPAELDRVARVLGLPR
jgi:hypothetical protein